MGKEADDAPDCSTLYSRLLLMDESGGKILSGHHTRFREGSFGSIQELLRPRGDG